MGAICSLTVRTLGQFLILAILVVRPLMPGGARGQGYGLDFFLDAIALLAACSLYATSFLQRPGRNDIVKGWAHTGEAQRRGKRECDVPLQATNSFSHDKAWLTVPLALLLLMVIVSTVVAAHKMPAISMATSYIAAGALFLSLARSPERLMILALSTTVATGVMLAFYGICQYFFVLPYLREIVGVDPRGVGIASEDIQEFMDRLMTDEAFGSFFISNTFAAYLALIFFILTGLVGMARRGWRKAVMFGLGILVLYCMTLTGSKGCFLAFVTTAVVLLVLFTACSLPLVSRIVRSGMRVKLLATLFFVGLIVVLVAGGIVERLAKSKSGRVRLGYWEGAVAMLVENPVLGVGLDNFGDRYSAHMTESATETQRVHNDYLQILVETGPVGLIAFVCFWWGVVLATGTGGRRGDAGFDAESKGSRTRDTGCETSDKRHMNQNQCTMGSVGRSRKWNIGHDIFLGFACMVAALFLEMILEGGKASLWNAFFGDTSSAQGIGFAFSYAVLGLVWVITYVLVLSEFQFRNPWVENSNDGNEKAREMWADDGCLTGRNSPLTITAYKGLRLCIAGGLATVFLHSLIDFNMYVPGIVVTVACIGGIGVSLASWGRGGLEMAAGSRDAGRHQTRSRLMDFVLRSLQHGIFAVAVIALMVVVVVFLPGAVACDLEYSAWEAHIKEGEMEAALERLVIASRANPLDVRPLKTLGVVYLDALKEAVKQEFKNEEIEVIAANARSYLEKALEILPMSSETHFYLGMLYETLAVHYTGVGRDKEKGRRAWQNAVREYEEARRFYPVRARTRARLGVAYYHVGRWSEAEVELDTALRLSAKADLWRLRLSAEEREEVLRYMRELR